MSQRLTRQQSRISNQQRLNNQQSKISSIDRRLNAKPRTESLSGQRIEVSVRPWLDLANALLELGEENLPSRREALRVELHALYVLPGVGAHGADEDVAFPRRELVAVVERQPRDR